MGWRFRRSVKVFPGFRLNFSKSGVSATLGIPGASITTGKRGTYLNAGIPGTGLYFREKVKESPVSTGQKPSMGVAGPTPVPEIFSSEPPDYSAIKSKDVSELSSSGLSDLVKVLSEALEHRKQLLAEGQQAKTEIARKRSSIRICLWCPFAERLLKSKLHSLREELGGLERDYTDLKKELDDTKVVLATDEQFDLLYALISPHFEGLISCERVWDVTNSVLQGITNDNVDHVKLSLQPVDVDFALPTPVHSKHRPLHFQNANGKDLYLFPAFLLVCDPKMRDKELAIIDLRDIEFKFISCAYQQRDPIPQDAFINRQLWAYANKDGSADKRVRDNYLIKELIYGVISITSPTGLCEDYMFSNVEKVKDFLAAMAVYKEKLAIATIHLTKEGG